MFYRILSILFFIQLVSLASLSFHGDLFGSYIQIVSKQAQAKEKQIGTRLTPLQREQLALKLLIPHDIFFNSHSSTLSLCLNQ